MTEPVPLRLADAPRRRGRKPLPPEERARRAAAREASRQARLALINPRLLDVAGAARYMGRAESTIRALLDAGELKRVTIPVGARDLRGISIDVRDLDRLIEGWKS